MGEAVVVLADIADLIAELAIVIMITDATTSVINATKEVALDIPPILIRDLEDIAIAIVAVVLEAVAVTMEIATVSTVEPVGAMIGTAKDLVANVHLEATEVVKNLLTLHPQAIVMPSILAMLKK